MDCQSTKEQCDQKINSLSLDDVLTINPFKKTAYSQDEHYIAGMGVLRESMEDRKCPKHFLWNHCMLLVRPDAFFLGHPHNIVDAFHARNLNIVGCKIIHINHAQAESLWWYQRNVMTSERRELLRELLASAPSVLLLIRDENPRNSGPATAHLTHLKGPSIARKRKPRHLRSIVAPATANVLSYLHASDDPADAVREMYLLLGADRMSDMLKHAQSKVFLNRFVVSYAHMQVKALLSRQAEICRSDATNGKFGVSTMGWETFLERAKCCIDYVSGESYDPYEATIPDGKDLVMALDEYLRIL